MFNSIQGVFNGKSADAAYILTGGIEWEIAMPLSDIESLPRAGGDCRVFTWLYHREDTMKLYGFSDETRRNTFLELLKVEGIGPKGALKIMGGIRQEDLEQALENEDLARLEAVPGLGKKTAQKMLLALKGKLVRAPAVSRSVSQYGDLVNALADMGYDRRAAADAIALAEKGLPEGLSSDEKEKLLFKNAIMRLTTSN
ncbi:MAG: Holliday junction branch migration protein RuvA [Treponema sp.]|jgi:Holliday junction DNA helicase RuvA|nr:Holliday junction branch migration protein RuvA [Treponema sp.]